jgi:hypothetical protein
MSHFARAIRILLATLREVFDESAYARFLRCQGVPSSPAAYAAFWRERESSFARRSRCC